MKRYKGVWYTTKRWPDKYYTWHTRYRNGDEIMTGGFSYPSKKIAEEKCRKYIDMVAETIQLKNLPA